MPGKGGIAQKNESKWITYCFASPYTKITTMIKHYGTLGMGLLALMSLSLLAPAPFAPSPSNGPEAHYATYCAGCHGETMEAFVDRKWVYGNSREDLFKAIKYGYEDGGMPSYDTTFTDKEVYALADYILGGIQKRMAYDFQDEAPQSDTFSSNGLRFHLDTVAAGIEVPWSMAFLPDGDMLITERGGTLYRRTKEGKVETVAGSPEVKARGQGGLMDVILHPDFETNSSIYLSYSKPKAPGDENLATTAILRAKLEGNRLTQQEDIFIALPYATTRHHYGSRLQFGQDGYLYFSVGDRGNREQNPQNLDNHCGKIHRIKEDGSIPEDNPFVEEKGAMASIYSYGHRNPQGVAMNPETGDIWAHEHGPRGGDELNLIQKGVNFGWPEISYGINYNGTTFTNKTAMDGMEQPVTYWIPSIAPSGMAFITGGRYPDWEGSLLVGSLRFKYLNLCRMEGNQVVEEEKLLKNIGRVRDVRMGPDRYIYVAVENPGYIFRLMPLGE